MNPAILSAALALAFQPPEPRTGGDAHEQGLPVPRIEPVPAHDTPYRLIARIDEDQGAAAAIFLHDVVERGPSRFAELLVVPLKASLRYKSGRPSHGRLWYEISCELRALRIVRARVYDPGDFLLPKHDQLFERPMVGAVPSETRYPDLIVPHACGAAVGGMSFRDPLAAIAYARTRPAPR